MFLLKKIKIQMHLVGTIAIDSIHTPIKNVKYHIENYQG